MDTLLQNNCIDSSTIVFFILMVLLSNIIALCDVLEQATQTKIDISGNIETGPHPTISVTAPIVKGNLEDIKNELPSLLSQVSKTA